MSEQPSSNVKIYARPERKGPSPLMLVIALLVVLVGGFFLYKAFYHPGVSPTKTPGIVLISFAGWQPRGIL